MEIHGRRCFTIARRNVSISISKKGGNGGLIMGMGSGWNKSSVASDQMEAFGRIGTLTLGYLLAFFSNSPTTRGAGYSGDDPGGGWGALMSRCATHIHHVSAWRVA